MSEDIETEMTQHVLCEFWGGNKRGVCVQVTALDPADPNNGYLQLDLNEASELAYQLSQYCLREANRRQDLLRKQIEGLKEMEKTVFKEVSEIRLADYESQRFSVRFVNQFAPLFLESKKEGAA